MLWLMNVPYLFLGSHIGATCAKAGLFNIFCNHGVVLEIQLITNLSSSIIRGYEDEEIQNCSLKIFHHSIFLLG